MTWETILTYAGISAVFSAVRTLIGPERRRKGKYFITAALSIPVGVIVGVAANNFFLTEGITFAIVAASALIAENILNVVIEFGQHLEEDPVGTIKKTRKMIRK